MVEVGLLVGFGMLVFKVPVRGSLLDAGRTVRARLNVIQRFGIADRFARQNH